MLLIIIRDELEGDMEILGLVKKIEDLVNNASGIPFSNKIVLDKDDTSEMIRRINESIPEEIRRAKWIKEEINKISIEAKKEAKEMIKLAKKVARSLADNLVKNNEITILGKITIKIWLV